eukprot:1144853-Pelagomonas_calceolata.AAC.1
MLGGWGLFYVAIPPALAPGAALVPWHKAPPSLQHLLLHTCTGGLWRHGASPLHASSACITDLLSAAARAAGGGKALIPADIKEHSCSNWSDASSQGVQWGGTNEQVEHASAASPSTTAISSSSSNLHSTHPFSRNHKHGSSNSISSSNSVSSSSSSNSSCSNSRGSLLATSHSVSQNAHHAESHAPLEQGTCRHLPSLSPRNLFLGLSAAACTGLHSNASPLGNIFLCTASPPFTLQGPARQFHAWYYASRNMVSSQKQAFVDVMVRSSPVYAALLTCMQCGGSISQADPCIHLHIQTLQQIMHQKTTSKKEWGLHAFTPSMSTPGLLCALAFLPSCTSL